MENKMMGQQTNADKPKLCPYCRKEISSKARKCPYCQSDVRSWPRKHPVATILLLLIGFFLFIGLLGNGSNNGSSVSTLGPQPQTWYYINQNYQCVVAGEFQFEDPCQQAVGAYCYSDALCGGEAKKITFYYINSDNKCVLAPHNPYPEGNSPANQQVACNKDVGQLCFGDDNTCYGAGTAGTVTIHGVPYTLATATVLKQNNATPGFIKKDGSLDISMIAVKGIIQASFPEKDGIYALVINTGDGFVVDFQGATDPNTKTSNGFYAESFPKGTRVFAGGAFAGNKNVSFQDFVQEYPQLGRLGLPADTPVLINEGGDGVQIMNAPN